MCNRLVVNLPARLNLSHFSPLACLDSRQSTFVRVKQPDDLLIFRGCRATRGVGEGVKRRSGGVRIEILVERVGGDCSVIRAEEVVEVDAEGIRCSDQATCRLRSDLENQR